MAAGPLHSVQFRPGRKWLPGGEVYWVRVRLTQIKVQIGDSTVQSITSMTPLREVRERLLHIGSHRRRVVGMQMQSISALGPATFGRKIVGLI
jgi:hypothetical protein